MLYIDGSIPTTEVCLFLRDENLKSHIDRFYAVYHPLVAMGGVYVPKSSDTDEHIFSTPQIFIRFLSVVQLKHDEFINCLSINDTNSWGAIITSNRDNILFYAGATFEQFTPDCIQPSKSQLPVLIDESLPSSLYFAGTASDRFITCHTLANEAIAAVSKNILCKKNCFQFQVIKVDFKSDTPLKCIEMTGAKHFPEGIETYLDDPNYVGVVIRNASAVGYILNKQHLKERSAILSSTITQFFPYIDTGSYVRTPSGTGTVKGVITKDGRPYSPTNMDPGFMLDINTYEPDPTSSVRVQVLHNGGNTELYSLQEIFYEYPIA